MLLAFPAAKPHSFGPHFRTPEVRRATERTPPSRTSDNNVQRTRRAKQPSSDVFHSDRKCRQDSPPGPLDVGFRSPAPSPAQPAKAQSFRFERARPLSIRPESRHWSEALLWTSGVHLARSSETYRRRSGLTHEAEVARAKFFATQSVHDYRRSFDNRDSGGYRIHADVS